MTERCAKRSGQSATPGAVCIIDPRRPAASVGLILLGAAAAFAVWTFRSKAIQDVALSVAFLYALRRSGRHFFSAWLNGPGLLALLFLVTAGVLMPFGADPATSWQGLIKRADFILLALALPVLLSTPRRVILFLFCGALAITALVTWDLVRLIVLYGRGVMAQARFDANPVLIHPNITAMAAGIAALSAMATALWQRRCNPLTAASVLVAAINVLYVILVQSRGAQLALLAAAALAVFFSLRGWRTRVLAVALAVACAAALVVVNPRFAASGFVDRDLVWRHTLTLVAQRPLVGYGFGETIFTTAYHQSAPPASPHRFFHPHMYWLNALFCFGGPAALIQAAMWLTLAVRLVRRMPGALLCEGPVERAAAFALIVFIQVAGLVDCTPGIVGLAALWSVPIALAVTRDPEPSCHA